MNLIALAVAAAVTGFFVYGLYRKEKDEEENNFITAQHIDIPILQHVMAAEKLGPLEPDDGSYIFINGTITRGSAIQTMREIIWVDNNEPIPYIVIYLNSIGGDAVATFALCQIMDRAKKPIEIRCFKANSAAALILASGTKGRRFMYKGAKVGIHSPRLSDDSKLDKVHYEEIILMRGFKLYSQSLVQKTAKSLREIIRDIKKEKQFSEKEAVEYGFADSVLFLRPSVFEQKKAQ